jgi:DNA-binding NarL/FixJ family response regulator
MAQYFPLRHRPRALIVDDEASFGISLEADMRALGFDVCDLATDGQQAFLLAVSDQPDVVLMDVCLEGGREGIEVARRLREVCDAAIVFVTGYTDRATIERIHERVPGAPVLPKAVYRDRLADAVAEVSKEPGGRA